MKFLAWGILGFGVIALAVSVGFFVTQQAATSPGIGGSSGIGGSWSGGSYSSGSAFGSSSSGAASSGSGSGGSASAGIGGSNFGGGSGGFSGNQPGAMAGAYSSTSSPSEPGAPNTPFGGFTYQGPNPNGPCFYFDSTGQYRYGEDPACSTQNGGNPEQLGLCARTVNETLYFPATAASCPNLSRGTAQYDQKFFPNCQYAGYLVPPYKCDSGPYPAGGGNTNPSGSNENNDDWGVCFLTINQTAYRPSTRNGCPTIDTPYKQYFRDDCDFVIGLIPPIKCH